MLDNTFINVALNAVSVDIFKQCETLNSHTNPLELMINIGVKVHVLYYRKYGKNHIERT